jgi:hypothetical protein
MSYSTSFTCQNFDPNLLIYPVIINCAYNSAKGCLKHLFQTDFHLKSKLLKYSYYGKNCVHKGVTDMLAVIDFLTALILSWILIGMLTCAAVMIKM